MKNLALKDAHPSIPRARHNAFAYSCESSVWLTKLQISMPKPFIGI